MFMQVWDEMVVPGSMQDKVSVLFAASMALFNSPRALFTASMALFTAAMALFTAAMALLPPPWSDCHLNVS